MLIDRYLIAFTYKYKLYSSSNKVIDIFLVVNTAKLPPGFYAIIYCKHYLPSSVVYCRLFALKACFVDSLIVYSFALLFTIGWIILFNTTGIKLILQLWPSGVLYTL